MAVDADGKRYVCVTCNASGDVFRFVQEVHGLDHDAAVEWGGGALGCRVAPFAHDGTADRGGLAAGVTGR